MKAAFYLRRGPAREVLLLGAQPLPATGPGEVRVRLSTSGVNPSDYKSRGGLTTSAPVLAPVIPHSDGGGVIEAVGTGVDPRRVGERVWIWNGQWQRNQGTAAQYIVLPSSQAVPLPASVDFDVAACLGIPALTALQAVRLSAADRSSTVLVHGGAGSVGHYAIQFAKRRGARVLATVSSAAKAAHALAAGADATIDYRAEQLGTRVAQLTDGGLVDAVIDVNYSANALSVPLVLRPHGRVVVYGANEAEFIVPGLWLMRNSISVLSFLVYDLSAADRAAVLGELGAALAAGWLRHTIALRLPLEEIAAAHEAVESGLLIGNVVLSID